MKIAVFIDFDNIEIGVKTTLGQPFDIAAILEGIKERGEVITKVAYGDWKRAGDHGRLLSQHAIRMVQRNLTPGGDKNGADINLALDALEMAFTHDHINAFVIVGGDSDFITLVEKLKQYDKKVFVVGGRQFTSLVMQKNCNEFIAYENLVGVRGGRGGAPERKTTAAGGGVSDVAKALPLVKRALKVLVDREVSPQLGLLKSTLLQLDSTFSEKDYGASTFRDFIEKVAQTGIVTLRHAGRSLLVDLVDARDTAEPEHDVRQAHHQADRDDPRRRAGDRPPPPERAPEPAPDAMASMPPADAGDGAGVRDAASAQQGGAPQVETALEHLQRIFARATTAPRWPMYVRQVKQFLRGIDDTFDERAYGFATIVEFLRAAQRENLLRLERDRQGVLRVFPGTHLQRGPVMETGEPGDAAAERSSSVTEGADRVSMAADGEEQDAEVVVHAEPVEQEPDAAANLRAAPIELPVQDVEPVETATTADGPEETPRAEDEDELPVARPPMPRRSRKTAAAATTTTPRTRTPRARAATTAAPRRPSTRGRKKTG